MAEIPAAPQSVRDAIREKFGSDGEREAALWAWGLGWADCRAALLKALHDLDRYAD